MDNARVDDLLIQVDWALGEQLLEAAEEAAVRRAPSVRGSELLALGAMTIAVVGSSADVMTLIVERHRIPAFARAVASRLIGNKPKNDRDHFTAEISTSNVRMSVAFEGNGDALADALRKLADLADESPST